MSTKVAAPSPTAGPVEEPIARGALGLALFVGALITAGLVATWFSLEVNRVFDVPKALALKVGGCGLFLVWLVTALFGPGTSWRAARLFAGPVAALAAAVTVSTLLSIDVPTSLHGVYERQFGLHGFLGCVGLFLVTATSLHGRRGALVGLAWLAALGGVLGTYAFLQAHGHDPFQFFKKPHDKVYAFLGNATFAGNALALVFPLSVALAAVATVDARAGDAGRAPASGVAWGAGFLLVGLLLVGPGWAAGGSATMPLEARAQAYKLGVGLGLGLLALLAAFGHRGPEGTRLGTAAARATCDGMLAGGLAALAFGVTLGLLYTRTRGAWVGSAAAVVGGLALLPGLSASDPARLARLRRRSLGGLAAVTALFGLFVAFAESVCPEPAGRCLVVAKTIRSIPAAFDPDRVDYGKGQGTRPYLWRESPRVLVDQEATWARQLADRRDIAARVSPDAIPGVAFDGPEVPTDAAMPAWRRVTTWLFGIGIETYRYAFMSHKSKRLEALDPMTNHDNPHNNYLYVLASLGVVGLAAYLWLLARLLRVAWRHFRPAPGEARPWTERAIALGVVTSFFSYAVYSIAGFDSVACSVFFYVLLGCAAAYFAPNGAEPARPLGAWLRAGAGEPGAGARRPVALSIALAAVMVPLLGHAVLSGWRIFRAEMTFVAPTETPRSRLELVELKASRIKEAIALNPDESFYRQSLGSTYSDLARALMSQTSKLEERGESANVAVLLEKARDYSAMAETAFYAALDHAWAPENVFISLFQLHYAMGDLEAAEHALERALEHSPHLGAVRANLAVLELDRKAYDEALADCQWVLEVDPRNTMALRTCGRAALALGDLDGAERHLVRAARLAPKDIGLKKLLLDLKKARAAATTTSATVAR